MTDINQVYTFASTADDLYRALTDEDAVKGWWTPDTQLKNEVNSKARFEFKGKGFFEMEVKQLQPGSSVEWVCTDATNPAWIGSNLKFAIESVDDGVKLAFDHTGRGGEDANHEQDSMVWGFFLGQSMKGYLEEGKGTPGVPE